MHDKDNCNDMIKVVIFAALLSKNNELARVNEQIGIINVAISTTLLSKNDESTRLNKQIGIIKVAIFMCLDIF